MSVKADSFYLHKFGGWLITSFVVLNFIMSFLLGKSLNDAGLEPAQLRWVQLRFFQLFLVVYAALFVGDFFSEDRFKEEVSFVDKIMIIIGASIYSAKNIPLLEYAFGFMLLMFYYSVFFIDASWGIRIGLFIGVTLLLFLMGYIGRLLLQKFEYYVDLET